MSSLNEILNQHSEFEYAGTKYTIKELDVENMGKYGLWLKEKALLAVDQMYLNRQEDYRYKEDRLAVINAAAAGVYDWGGECWVTSITTPEGIAKLLELSIFQAGGMIEFHDAQMLVRKKTLEIQEYVAKTLQDTKKSSALRDLVAGKICTKSSPQSRSAKAKKQSRKRR